MQGGAVAQDSLEDGDQAQSASGMDISLDGLHLDQAHLPGLNGKADEFMESLDPMQDSEFNGSQEEGEEDIDPDDDWSEDDDRPSQYDLRQYGVYRSLPIPHGLPNMESDCDTAEEYLRRVR